MEVEQNETIFCVACSREVSQGAFLLLNGSALCGSCFAVIKSRAWLGDFFFPEHLPKPPGKLDKLKDTFDPSRNRQEEYKRNLVEYRRRRDEFFRRKETERQRYHGICIYWPKKQPPDWRWRRQEILKRAGEKCEHCGESSDILYIHHISPRQKGGNHAFSNLIALCSRCHSKEKGKGHSLILKPRSDDTLHEHEVVKSIKGSFGYWKRCKAKGEFFCHVCRKPIVVGNTFFIRFDLPAPFGIKREIATPYGKKMESARVSIRKATAVQICHACEKRIYKGQKYFVKTSSLFDPPQRVCPNCCSKRTQIVCSYCNKRYRFKI